MKLSILYHLLRADFLERVRRQSFIFMLMAVSFLGYQVAVGNVTVRLDIYRGEFNSAWVGSMMSLISSFFLGWFGFYLVKGTITRDRETGIGQILATTPLTRVAYVFGKFASNFAVLVAMNLVLAVASIGIQFLAGENMRLDLVAMFAPFLLIALPMMAVVSAVAVLFECVGFLRGGFGNVVYFFLFIFIFPLADQLSATNPALEPLGMGLFQQSMGAAAEAAFPAYEGGFVLGDPAPSDLGVDLEPASYIFPWAGVDWTLEIVLKRLVFLGLAIFLTLVASVFFDRFDPARGRGRKGEKVKRRKGEGNGDPAEMGKEMVGVGVPVQLTGLAAGARETFGVQIFIQQLTAELKLLLKGQTWWWYAGAVGLLIAQFTSPLESVREIILPMAWIWPVLVWSGMGNRERQKNTAQMVFSAPHPLRQVGPVWVAGFLVAVLTGAGAGMRLLGEPAFVGWLVGALFIPSLALALGVISGGSRLFEVVYLLFWYIGPMNRTPALDYVGALDETLAGGLPWVYLVAAGALVGVAVWGRGRELQR